MQSVCTCLLARRSSLHDATGAVHLLHHGFDLEFQRDYRPVFRRLQGDICFKSYSRRCETLYISCL